MLRSSRLTLLAIAGMAMAVAPASASSRMTIRGAGFGHGVGMSQYGAMGFAQQGAGYAEILGHYYTGTALGTTDPARVVRVLLQTTRGAAAFTGAERVGTRTLEPAKSYRVVRRAFDQVDLQSTAGKRIATFTAPLQVDGGADGIVVASRGAYRGILELRPGAFGIDAINAVALEVAARGAQGTGSRRPHLCGHDLQGRRRLRPVRRHALTGVPRHRRRNSDDRPCRGRDRRSGRDLSGPAGRHLLLLHLRRAHGERRERLRRRAPALAAGGRRSLRRRFAAPSLDRRDAGR